VWWIIFTVNRLSSSATNVDSDIDDEKIETVWDLPPESDGFEETYPSTVSSLFMHDSSATYVYDDTANVVRSKCIVLTDRAARIGSMATSTPKGDRAFWGKFGAVDQAIRRVADSLPSISEESRYEAGAPHVESQTRKVNRFTVDYHTFMCDATIRLHSRLARAGHIASRDACLEACWRLIPIVRQIIAQDMADSVYLYLAVTWTRVFREFAIEHDRLLTTRDFGGAGIIIFELKVLSKALKKRAGHHLIANSWIANLKREFPSLRSVLDML